MRHGKVGPLSHLPPAPGWVYDHETLQWGHERGDVFDASDWVRYNQVHNDYAKSQCADTSVERLSTTWFPIESAPLDELVDVCGVSREFTRYKAALTHVPFATVARRVQGINTATWFTMDGKTLQFLGWEPMFWRVMSELPSTLFHIAVHGTNEGQL